jgi:death on curing protein
VPFDAVIDGHHEHVLRYGGTPGIRDIGLLESALEQPKAGFGNAYLHDTIFLMAAAYLYHVVKNHAFVDGNKRGASGAH